MVSRLSVAVQHSSGTPGVDAAIAALATRAHGVVTRSGLLEAGVSPGQIRERLKRGALIRLHRGVYRAGHTAPSREATYLAAVKACGGRAALAGRSAAHLWGLIKGQPPSPEVITAAPRRVAGVLVHRERSHGRVEGAARQRVAHREPRHWSRDVTSRLSIPVTTVPRTLVDLASCLTEQSLARACHDAGVLHRTTPAQIEAVLARRPSSPGAGTLRRVLHGEVPVTMSALEARFLARLRDAGLPLPATNVPVGGRRVDCRWPERRLTVELDGYRYHHSRHAWEQDRLREREAHARGDDFRRFTYGDVFERPAAMLRELRALL